MPTGKQLKAKCARGKYASGGRVMSSRKGEKITVNVISPPAATPSQPPMVPPAPPMGAPSPQAGPPVPPEAAAMAINQMQGKPGAPGGFKRGGRVVQKAGAESGLGRIQNAAAQKKVGKASGKTAPGGKRA